MIAVIFSSFTHAFSFIFITSSPLISIMPGLTLSFPTLTYFSDSFLTFFFNLSFSSETLPLFLHSLFPLMITSVAWI